MQLVVQDPKVKKIIEDADKLVKKVGVEIAKMVKRRINEIMASPNFKEYLNYGLGKPHPLSGNLNHLFGIHLNKNYRLIVEPLSEKLDDNSLKECKNVNIKGVVEYHDGKNEWLIP